VSTGLRLGEYAITPLYNIKAVVQATGISPSTLRAWERRYNIARPERSDSGYRLYAERDVAVIRWLKAQVDAGMSISQAVSWLGNIVTDAGKMEQAVLPVTGSGATLHDSLATSPSIHLHREQVRDFATLQQELISALANYNEEGAEAVVTEAFSMFSVEQAGEKLFMPVLHEIEAQREQGIISITTEHFASNYLTQRLGSLLRFIPNGTGGPLVWVACGRSELHEVSALLLSIYLRRSGYQVHYLGQNLPTEERTIKDFINEAVRQQPSMLLFSVSTVDAAEELSNLSSRLSKIVRAQSIIGYSGSIFSQKPELQAAILGIYMGATANEITQNMESLMSGKSRPDKKLESKKDT
jgi:MerR family transcriptional regulator, light-induced transcriptional regulator